MNTLPTMVDMVEKYGGQDQLIDAFLFRKLTPEEDDCFRGYGNQCFGAMIQRRIFELIRNPIKSY